MRMERGSCVREKAISTKQAGEEAVGVVGEKTASALVLSSRHSSASGIHQLQHQKQDSREASALARLRSSGHPSPVDDLLRDDDDDDDDVAGEGDQTATAMTTSLEAPPPTVAENAEVTDAHEMTDRGRDELIDAASEPPIIVSEPPVEGAEGNEAVEGAKVEANEEDLDLDPKMSERGEDILNKLDQLQLDSVGNEGFGDSFQDGSFELPSSRPETPFDADDPTVPSTPFPALQILNLSSNNISDEDSLLGLIRFPVLKQLFLEENPVFGKNRRTVKSTTTTSLLRNILVDQLGIHVTAKKNTSSGNERSLVKINSASINRKVKPPLPPVPKKNKQLMLTAPPEVLRNYMELARIEFTPRQPETPVGLSKTPSLRPLPEIGQRFVEGRAAASPDSVSSPSSKSSSKLGLKEEEEKEEDEGRREMTSSRERGDGKEEQEEEASIGGSRISVVGEEEEEEEEGGVADDEGEEGLGGFFMTQDEDAEEKIFSPRESGVESGGKQSHIIERETLISGKSSSLASPPLPPPRPPPRVVPPNFRGFEVFLDGADEQIDAGFPEWRRNIQTNVANMKTAIGRANAFVPVKRQRLERVYPVRFRRGGGGGGGGGGGDVERDMRLGKRSRSERMEFLAPTTPSSAQQQQQQQHLLRQQQQESRSQRRPKSETIMEALRTMKSGVPKMAEDKLRSTLEENARTPRRKQKFPEAEALLSRVQKQYNHVRVESLQDTLEAKDAIMSALRRMEKVLEHDGE